MRPLTKLGLRPLLYSKGQRVYTTPLPFVSPPPSAPRQIPLSRWQSNKVPPSSGSPPKVADQPGVTGKEAEVIKGVIPNAIKPPAAPQDPIKDKEAPRMDIFLATLPLPAKGDPKGTDKGSSKAVVSKSKALPKEKM